MLAVELTRKAGFELEVMDAKRSGEVVRLALDEGVFVGDLDRLGLGGGADLEVHGIDRVSEDDFILERLARCLAGVEVHQPDLLAWRHAPIGVYPKAVGILQSPNLFRIDFGSARGAVHAQFRVGAEQEPAQAYVEAIVERVSTSACSAGATAVIGAAAVGSPNRRHLARVFNLLVARLTGH